MANAWIIPPVAFTAASPFTAVGDASNLALDYAGLIWRSTLVSGPYVRIDLGADMIVDTIAMFGLAGSLSTATFQIYGSTAAQGAAARARPSGAQPLLAGSAMPVSGLGTALFALPSTWPAIRYIDIEFTGLASGYISFSRLVIGQRIQLSRNFSYGAEFGVRDLGSLDFSARGVLLRRRGAKLRTVSLTFSSVRKDEVETITKPLLERIGNTEMVALFTDPVADAQRQNRGYFGALVGDLTHAWAKASGFETKANVVSIF